MPSRAAFTTAFAPVWFGVAALTAFAALLALGAAPAAAATTWVVAPGATSTTSPCTTASPCSYLYALANAGNGDTVQFESGEYDYDGATTNQSLSVPDGVTLEPAPGDPTRPLLKQTSNFPHCNCQFLAIDENTTVEGLAIDQSVMPASNEAAALIMASGDTLTDSVITGINGIAIYGAASSGTAEVSDTVIAASGNGGAIGVLDETTGGAEATLDNDTVLATGTDGIALETTAMFAGDAAQIVATNTIAQGSLDALSAGAATESAITLDYSDYTPMSETITGPASAINLLGNHNITATPSFASGSYEEAAGSATIGAGESDPASGSSDYEGYPRTTNGLIDIGAGQFSPPILGTASATALTDSGATIEGSVNPDDSATTYEVLYGPTSSYGSATGQVSLAAGVLAQSVAVPLTGLSPSTTYHFAIEATNAFGSVTTADGTFATAAAPSPPAPVVTPAPVDSGLALSRSRFAVASAGASIAAKRPVGTIVTYTDSEVATTTFTVLHKLPGVKSNGSCVAPPRHRRPHHRYVSCTRLLALGSFTHADVMGANSFEFTGRVGGRALNVGSYALSAVPENSAGASGAAVKVAFTIEAKRG